ncbi:MAG: TetR/AcrR family transcriptional regulator [Actinomycetales bacterium]|nr:TetR/AcrR family transcriptional regulator [Actinomycetales bacterium]
MSETEPRPDSPRRARTRERLMDAAFEVFAEQGLAATSVEQVAEHAGFTRGAFYSNFSTKEELLLALMTRERDRWVASLSERVPAVFPFAAGPPIEAEIGAAVAALLAGPTNHRHAALIQGEFRLLALRDPELARAFEVHRMALEDSLVDIVDDAVSRSGRRLRLDTRSMVRVVVALHQDAVERSILAGAEGDPMESVHLELARLLTAITELR